MYVNIRLETSIKLGSKVGGNETILRGGRTSLGGEGTWANHAKGDVTWYQVKQWFLQVGSNLSHCRTEAWNKKKKKKRFSQDSNPSLPDTNWTMLLELVCDDIQPKSRTMETSYTVKSRVHFLSLLIFSMFIYLSCCCSIRRRNCSWLYIAWGS